ncbi:MAG: glycosyltransferase family 2 protein [Symbiobacteriaceae bacterium]|nr:glycosyltransferase family 2 protein [Symbiobacteriaceae bacterium]
MSYALVIPSLDPCQRLIDLVDELIGYREKHIVIVNDGSAPEHRHIFDHLRHYPQVTILEHEVNLGKGAALKTAFAYCAQNLPHIVGVVTADSDGQHSPQDIRRIAAALMAHPQELILGVRQFSRDSTPWKSFAGNRSISAAFKLLYGVTIRDTQTGLRGIPRRDLSWMVHIRGERFEYEMNMLIQARRRRLPMRQVPIETIYIDENRASHFKAVRDSAKITMLLIRNFFSRSHEEPNPYGAFFYFTRGVLKLRLPRLQVQDREPTPPVVLVGHHQNLRGALGAMVWLNFPVRLWMYEVFCDLESCYHQYADYTFSQRMRMPPLLAKGAAFVASHYVSRLATAMRAIPVYRNSQKTLHISFKESIAALLNEEHLLLFPDIDYTSDDQEMSAMYTGFINLDKYYYDKTKRHLSFVPIQINEEAGYLRLGNPSSIRDGEPFALGKRRIAAELLEELNKRG